MALVAPSLPYLRMLAGGLVAARGWTIRRAAEYLAGLTGAPDMWLADDLEQRLADASAR